MSTVNSSEGEHQRLILKSTSLIALGTLSSRILGFFRDIILANIFGTGMKADCFFVALKIPNLFRDLVGEGATNSAVVPVLSEYHQKKERKEFWQFVAVIFLWAFLILSFLTMIGVLMAPFLIRVIAPGFLDDLEKFSLTVQLTRMMFPYLIFIGLVAYSMAILYTFRLFLVPAFSPCLLNIAMITSAVLAASTMPEPIYGLAIGVLAGGILQFLVQIPPLFKTGIIWQWPRSLNHPGVAKVGRLLIPRLFGAGIYQLSVFVDTFCASLSFLVGLGGISAIYYANRIVQFPMGIFSIALASAVLPTLSSLAALNNHDQLKSTLKFAIANNFFIMFPISFALILLAEPVIRVLFERGEFDHYSTMITAITLLFYSIGLFSFGGIKILVTVFYALQDTKTPVKVAAFCLVLNILLNVLLIKPLKIGGIALANSLASLTNFLILFYLIEKRLGEITSQLKLVVGKVTFATLGLGVFVSWSKFLISQEVLLLLLVGFLGPVIYGLLCYALKVETMKSFFSLLKR